MSTAEATARVVLLAIMAAFTAWMIISKPPPPPATLVLF